jgi:hypothetical protein
MRASQFKEQNGSSSTGLVLLRPGPKSRLEENFFDTIEQLRALGSIQCTQEEAAAVLRVSRATLYRFFVAYPEAVEAFEEGKEEGRASLRRAQFKSALAGNAAMQIWLGKQLLGQRDKHDIDVSVVNHEEALRALA